MNKNFKYYAEGEDLRFAPITAEQERTLFCLAKLTGDEADKAREFLIRNHLLFAANVARRMVRGRLPEDEVISAANAALMDAFDRFDHERGNRFTTYLKPFICSAIAQLWASKNPVRFPKGKYPEPLEAPGIPITETVCDHPVEAEDYAAYMKAALKKTSLVLDDVEKALLTEIYENGKSLSDVARERKLSRQRIQQIHSGAIKKLREAMKQRGITEL